MRYRQGYEGSENSSIEVREKVNDEHLPYLQGKCRAKN
jgi:hypothetical protein